VLLNLVVNAADAVAEVAAPADRRWVEVASRREADGQVTISVEDGGKGLTERARARLFEPFFTTKPPGAGTGLGLALSHEYVTSAGGRLAGANGSRGGAVFEVRLPVRADPGGCNACCRPAGAEPGHLRAVGA